MDVSGIVNNANNTHIQEVETIITDYNDNMRYYNRNMRDLIEIYRERISDEMLRNRTTQRQNRFQNYNSRPIYTSIYDIYNALNDPSHRNMYTTTTQLQDVIVRPTNQQIQLATENLIYDISLSQIRCPISLEAFEEGDTICRIKHCGHLFKRPSLMSWFQRNVRCPVCRYDVREYVEENSESEPESEEEETTQPTTYERSNNQTSDTRSTNMENVTNILRSFLTNEINRSMPYVNNAINELTFTFDLPVDWDVSYNNSRSGRR